MRTGIMLIKGIKWTSFSTILTTFIQMAQHLILAWLLLPTDFGIMSAVLVVVNIIAPFCELGISGAIIQAPQITDKQLSTLYWLNILSGIFVFVISCLSAPLISLMFFREIQISHFLRIIFLFFIIQSIGVTYKAIFNRLLRFELINIIAVISSVFSFAVAILMALLDFGVYSLIGAFLAGAAIDSVIYFIKGRRLFKPRLYFNLYGVRKELKFGFFQSGARLVNSISANIDKLLISNFLGVAALGYYSWAWNIVMIPLRKINPIFMKVAFPVFSSSREKQGEINKVYIYSVTGIMILSTPVLIVLAASSEVFVSTIFGVKWVPAANVLSILSIVGVLKAFANPGGSVIMSRGRADIDFYWNLLWSVGVAGIIILVLLNLEQTIEAVAWAQLAAGISLGWIWHSLISRFGKINYRILLRSVSPIFFIALLTFLSIFFIGHTFLWEGWRLLMVEVIFGLSLYSVLGYFFYKEYLRKAFKAIKG